MSAFWSRYSRFVISLLLIVSWLIFLSMTTHTRDYYFFRMAKEVVPGEIISWRNDASKLVLSGWSPAEQEFRWSQNRRVGICFKPDKALFQQSEYNGELSVTIEFVPIPALEGKEIQFSHKSSPLSEV